MLNTQEDKLIALIMLVAGSLFIGLGTKNFNIGMGVFLVLSALLILK